MGIRKLLKVRKEPSTIIDYGIGCCNRVFTQDHEICCRINGIRNKQDCKPCEEKNIF